MATLDKYEVFIKTLVRVIADPKVHFFWSTTTRNAVTNTGLLINLCGSKTAYRSEPP